MKFSVVRLFPVVFVLSLIQLRAGPAPPPVLKAPLDHATAVPTATTLSWSVRDGVTNRSPIRTFTTEQVVLPALTIVSRAVDNVTLSFDTRTDLFYSIEQTDNLPSIVWNEVVPSTQGTGNSMTFNLSVYTGSPTFWRLRVSR